MASSVSPPSTEPRCFMHIPKSAGKSIRGALEQALPAAVGPKWQDRSMFCCGFSQFDELNSAVRATLAIDDDEVASLGDHAIVSGHFSMSTLRRVTSASSVATVLREPRARVLSMYAFWRLFSRGVRDWWEPYDAPNHALRPLDEFLAEPLVAAQTDNLICRMLLGDDRRLPPVRFMAESDRDAVAQDAIATLDTLGYVGVVELGDSMWHGVSRFFGVALSPKRLNMTAEERDEADAPPARSTVTADTLDLLDARTSADAIVYRHALLANDCSPQDADRLPATALAAALVQVGNLIGTSAVEYRTRGRTIEELTERLRSTEEELHDTEQRLHVTEQELERTAGLVHETRRALTETTERLRWHQSWLEGIQRSASWRLTRPLRAGKKIVARRPNAAGPRPDASAPSVGADDPAQPKEH